jgi:hypothetical protein
MTALSHYTKPAMPEGMRPATKDEFFARLAADKRDIMPTTESPNSTPWRVVSTRAMWGWSTPGWRNPGAPKAWAVQA